MITLNSTEKVISEKISELKNSSGSHSPSIFTIIKKIPELEINIDACFLSNPYATDLFLENLTSELIQTGKLRDYMEFYPSQNDIIAKSIAKSINLDSKNIFVGNGAIEVIQAVMHNYVKNSIVVNIPTFSSYYEFVIPGTKVHYYQLNKNGNYLLDTEEYLNFVKNINPSAVVIINPNNPNGGYLNIDDLDYILQELDFIDNIIIDESFIHFAYENKTLDLKSATNIYNKYSNLIIIKSMSKDFGIAGIRAGYGVMSQQKVKNLLLNGYLWNCSGLTEYFFKLYSNKTFFDNYNQIRKIYISETKLFFDKLSSIPQIKVYPTMANFALIELLDGSLSSDFVSKMLIKFGIYTRICDDKIGLQGEFVRIASRTKKENQIIINSIKNIFND